MHARLAQTAGGSSTGLWHRERGRRVGHGHVRARGFWALSWGSRRPGLGDAVPRDGEEALGGADGRGERTTSTRCLEALAAGRGLDGFPAARQI